MKYLKTYEEWTPVEWVAPEREHPSYKNNIRRRKRKKLGEMEPLMVLPNKVKDLTTIRPEQYAQSKAN